MKTLPRSFIIILLYEIYPVKDARKIFYFSNKNTLSDFYLEEGKVLIFSCVIQRLELIILNLLHFLRDNDIMKIFTLNLVIFSVSFLNVCLEEINDLQRNRFKY